MTISVEKQNNLFEGIVGQDEVKKRLNFYLQNYQATGVFKSILFQASRGSGKSYFCENIARHLKEYNSNRIRKYIKISGGVIKSRREFIDSVVFPFLITSSCTLDISEIHLLNSGAIGLILDLINPTPTNINTINIDGNNYSFDLRKFSFLASTTNSEKLPLTFLDRVEIVNLTQYSLKELSKIIQLNLKGINIEDGLLLEIAKDLRFSPRECVRIAFDIKGYCQSNNKYYLDSFGWNYIKNSLSILPNGVSPSELQIMRVLQQIGPCSLTKLSAILSLNNSSVRSFHEIYLLKKNFIEIQPGGRRITNAGIKYLEELDNH